MTDRPELFEDARDLLDSFDDALVDYIVVGAHAMAAHGVPRATGDFDVWVRPTAENAERVIRALTEFGAPLENHGVEASDFATPGTVYQMGLPPRRIDVLTRISGVAFDAAWSARIEAEVDGRTMRVLGRDDLLRNKRASGRPKDLIDANALESGFLE